MVSKVGLAVLAASLVLVPAASGSPAIWGTEEDPELADPPGNVQYSPLYTGPHDRDHVDLLAGWFEFFAHNNTLMFTLKVGSFEDVFEEADGWFLLYGFSGNVSNGQQDTATLRYSAVKTSDSTSWGESVNLGREGQNSVPVPHGFVFNETTPGYFRWYVPMDYLQNWGVQVAEFEAFASEMQMVAHTAESGVFNRNPAQSDDAFVWKDLEPARVNATDDEFLTPRSPEPTSTTAAESVAVGVAASAAAFLVAFAWRRRT